MSMDEQGYRNIWISIAVILPVGAVGLFVLRDNPEAKGMMVFALLICGGALCLLLDARERRKREKADPPR